MQRILLIPFKKLEDLEIEIKTLKEIPLDIKKDMAIADLSVYEFVDEINLAEEYRQYNYDIVYCHLYEV